KAQQTSGPLKPEKPPSVPAKNVLNLRITQMQARRSQLERAQRFVGYEKRPNPRITGRRIPIQRVFIQPKKLIANGHTTASEVTDREIRAPHQPIVAQRLDD